MLDFESLKDASRRAAWWASTRRGLVWMTLAGLALRLVLAVVSTGFPFDMASFAGWAGRLAEEGPLGFYPTEGEEFFVDYPPGYLWVLWVLGVVSRGLTGGAPSEFLLKLPAIGADLGIAWVAAALAARLTPVTIRRRFPVRGVVAAAVLFNPALIFVSAVWGQVDALLALLVLASFWFLATGTPSFRREAAGMALLALAVGTKPQGIFVLPFVVLLLLWRHVRGAVAGREERGAGAAALAGIGRVAALGAVSLGTGIALMASFGVGPVQAVRFFAEAGSTYTVTSVFAFNFWGAVGFWRSDLHDTAAGEAVRLAGVPAFYLALAAFGAGTAALLGRAWLALRRGEMEARVLVFGGVAMICLAFAVLTRIHERYLFLGLACLAPLVAWPWMRRAYVGLSLAYLVNVWFPYVYYLEFDGQSAPRLGPVFDILYGRGLDSPQLRTISVLTAVACLAVAWLGWRWFRVPPEPPPAPGPTSGRTPEADAPLVASAPVEAAPRPPWRLTLHPVGRRGAALALVAFLVVLATRLAWVGEPPGMYFDEVYHARTAGEYLQGKDVYEWTHPPLAKELMAASVRGVGGIGARGRGELADGMDSGMVDAHGSTVVWAAPGAVQWGRLDGCEVRPRGGAVRTTVTPTAVAVWDEGALLGGTGREGPVLALLDAGGEQWRVPVPAVPERIATIDGAGFVVGVDGSLGMVDRAGEFVPLAPGALGLDADRQERVVWVSFPAEGRVAAYGTGGQVREATVQGQPAALAVAPETSRLLVAGDQGLESVDADDARHEAVLGEVSADRLAAVPGSGLVWAFDGDEARLIEPLGMSTIGRAELPEPPLAVSGATEGTVLAVSSSGITCLGGRPAFGWRFGSAIFGAAMAALAALIALRMFGSTLAAGLAALFVAVDGLAFTLARIAMNDSYVTAGILAAWFCALSCLYRTGAAVVPEGDAEEEAAADVRSRWPAVGWMALTGLSLGFAVASKWVGLYALGGIGLLFLWDLWSRGRRGLWGLVGGPVMALIAIGVFLVLVPAGVYVASYIPYFALGNSFGDLLELQRGMYTYHAHLTATHPFGSPWYGWPVGHRAVWIYLGSGGGGRAEIWTVGNPVVFVGGLLAFVSLAVAAVRARSVAFSVIVFAVLVQFVPWTLVDRVAFLYHYLPIVPFLAIALGWWLAVGERGMSRRGAAVAVAALATAVFVALLPVLAGISVPDAYHDAVRAVLPWVF